MNIGLKMTKVKMTRTKFAFTTNYCSFSPFRWNKPEKTKATDFCIELSKLELVPLFFPSQAWGLNRGFTVTCLNANSNEREKSKQLHTTSKQPPVNYFINP